MNEEVQSRCSKQWRHPQSLTAGELRVLRGLIDGSSNSAIARRLRITEDGVKYHLKSIYSKWGVSGRGEAVFVALQLGLLSVARPEVAEAA